MGASWITLYPNWYVQEIELLKKHYPQLKIDEDQLRVGNLVLYGNLVVRPPGGAKEHAIKILYPAGTPYEQPSVTPIESLPEWKEDGSIAKKTKAKMLDHRHQMPGGNLCLFQRETRIIPGGDVLRGIDVLKRAEKYFIGFYTGRWPPDTAETELESHFNYAANVLMANTFFESVPDGYGRFFFVPDIRRLRDVQSRNCPIIITAMTEESGIIQNFDARKELARVYPWIDNIIWDSYDFLEKELDLEDSRRSLQYGYWWSLPKEPLPFHNGAGLLRTLATATGEDIDKSWESLSERLGADLTTDESHYIGFRYPARGGGYEWLILWVFRERPESSGTILIQSESAKRRSFEESALAVLNVHRIKPTVLRQRNMGVVAEDIDKKNVALIGLGALGSKVAELLAQAGVGKFRLCDPERLKTGNVARHIGGVSDFGEFKINVVMSLLLEINPYLDFEQDGIIYKSAVNSLDTLAKFMAPADLTICTTADESVESIVNQIAVINRKPVLYGRSIRRGSMGRVFLVRPGRDACKTCLANYLISGRSGEKTPKDWIDVPEEEDDVIYHECGRPIIASSAVDLSFTASLISRIALNLLEEKKVDYNHWLWSQFSAEDIDPRLALEMTTFAGRIPLRGGCSACQEPDVTGLIMTEDIKNNIVTMTESSPQVETGGVLIGFVDERNQAVAIRATGPGPKAIRTATKFHRDIEHIQSELDHAASELGSKGLYIGEWHSHLVAEPKPSPTDIESLLEISKAPNYLTRCPVMIITGFDKNTNKFTTFGSWVFPIGGRIYNIKNNIIEGDVL